MEASSSALFPRMARTVSSHWMRTYYFLLHLVILVRCDSNVTVYTNLSDAIPQLQDIYNFPLHRPVGLGGQNFTVCCLKAVNESYQVVHGITSQAASTENRFIDLSIEDLSATQFPCGASYNGSDAGAPLVTVPYSWCRVNCGGWQESSNRILTQWVQPFVGYILPAAVFCLNVPRKMVIRISEDLFRGRYDEISSVYVAIKFDRHHIIGAFGRLLFLGAITILVCFDILLKGIWAAAIALVDTVIWVSIVFSTAAPMIISGLYEATLDRMVIDTIQKDQLRYAPTTQDPLYLKVHLLYAILVGNLNLHYPEDVSDDPDKRYVWDDVRALVAPFALQCENFGTGEKNATDSLNPEIRQGTKIRLNSMLGCQASFGAAIGAPVVFFLGSFFVSVFGNLSTVGDNDTSHALAFGMWWMTMPAVAIVAGCLLAGNNPNTLEVIVCGLSPWDTVVAPETITPAIISPTVMGKISGWVDTTIKLMVFAQKKQEHSWDYLNLYRPFYDSVYQPTWMSERGKSKRTWVRRVQAEFFAMGSPGYQFRHKVQDYKDEIPDDYRNFRVGMLAWMNIAMTTMVLMITPFLLAFLTSYYTPTVGLSCRSFTFLMYLVFQFLLSLLWLWDFRFDNRSKLFSDLRSPFGIIHVPTVFCVIMGTAISGSAFTTIVGTYLQLLGAYRNCLCSIPISAWISGNYNIVLSTNSAQAIDLAQHFWLPTGVTAIVTLIAFCYVGWWYQRHWRRRFAVVIDQHLDLRQKSPRSQDRPHSKNRPIPAAGAIVLEEDRIERS